MPKSKSHGKFQKPLTPPAPPRLVKRRHSPGGKILCANGHIVPRRRYNAALRFRQIPSCNICGSTDMEVQGVHEVRGGLVKRLVFRKREGKLR